LAASVANVRINHRYIKDPTVVQAQEHRLAAILGDAHATLDRLLHALT